LPSGVFRHEKLSLNMQHPYACLFTGRTTLSLFWRRLIQSALMPAPRVAHYLNLNKIQKQKKKAAPCSFALTGAA